MSPPSHRGDLRAWDRNIEINPQLKLCRAKGAIKIESNDHGHLSGDFVIRFKRDASKSQLDAIVYGPFKSALGRLTVDGQKSLWTDDSGTQALDSQPLLAPLFKESWWLEMDFLFGIVTKKSGSWISKDETGEAVQYKKGERLIDCLREQGAPKTCFLRDREVTARMDFTSVDCRDSL